MKSYPVNKYMARYLLYLINYLKKCPITFKLFEFLRNNPLYKEILFLGSGTVVAQIIGIISLPIITRIYSPSDLGVLAIFSSLLAIVGIGATLRFEFAFLLPKEDREAINLFGLCLLILCITTTLSATIFLYGDEILTTFNKDFGIIKPYIYFLPFGLMCMGLYTILNYWAIRQQDYKRIAHTTINRGLVCAVTKIVLGILSYGPMGLIIGVILSQIAGIGTLSLNMWKKERDNLKMISLSRMKQVAYIYRSFPIFNFPASIVNTISIQIPLLMLLIIYDARIAGLYTLAYTVVVLPGSIITNSMGQAYLGDVAKMIREKSPNILSFYLPHVKTPFLFAIPIIGIPALCAPFVFPLIFGTAWVEAGFYCLPLAVMIIANFAFSPTSNLSTYGYNHWQLSWDLIRTSSLIGGFILAETINLSPIQTIIIYSFIMAIMYILLFFLNQAAINRIYWRFQNE